MDNLSREIQLTKSQIIEGDALSTLIRLPKDFFQLILTDPPYNVSRKNNLHTLGRKGVDFGDWDKDFNQTAWIDLALPRLKPGGSIVIFNDWKNLSYIAKYLTNSGMSVKRMLTWVKKNPFPRNINRSFTQTTEHAIWAVKSGAKWKFHRRNPASYERGVFEYPVQRSKHPTKKPDGLFSELIEILSDRGDWILDPYTGSGTTNYAAEKLGRNHVGIEKNPEYAKLARGRL